MSEAWTSPSAVVLPTIEFLAAALDPKAFIVVVVAMSSRKAWPTASRLISDVIAVWEAPIAFIATAVSLIWPTTFVASNMAFADVVWPASAVIATVESRKVRKGEGFGVAETRVVIAVADAAMACMPGTDPDRSVTAFAFEATAVITVLLAAMSEAVLIVLTGFVPARPAANFPTAIVEPLIWLTA
jgi:hypothetical protein